MRILKKNAQIAPSTFFATLLNSPCSSLLLTNATPASTVYLVVGKSNGETVFFPTDRSECISKFECEMCVPITALVAGDLRNIGKKEIVTITTNGLLQSLSYPSGEPPCPSRVFCQQIYANVCFAEILDIDNDGQMEFLVTMTDRVVRSYRFSSDADRLIPLNKWEMPAHIGAFCIGLGREKFALISQCNRHQYVQLGFGNTKHIEIVHSKSPSAQADEPVSTLVVASKPHSLAMFHCLTERIVVVNREKGVETELQCADGGVSCATVVRLAYDFAVLITVDAWGEMSVYGWPSDDDEEEAKEGNGEESGGSKGTVVYTKPLAVGQVSRDVNYICGFPGTREYSLIVSTVNIYNKIAIFSLDLSHIVADR